jgi:hypothetical protein
LRISKIIGMAERLPLHLISGFLGSGKTTLLRRLLDMPAFGDSAVLVNEIGEIGLDHHLLRHIDGETILLRSGCICCSMRDDLGQALRELLDRRDSGAVLPFSRVIVEGTGLADPVPILSTVVTDPTLRHHFRIGRVVTVVDAANAVLQLRDQPEFAKQVAVADRILLSPSTRARRSRPSPIRRWISPVFSQSLGERQRDRRKRWPGRGRPPRASSPTSRMRPRCRVFAWSSTMRSTGRASASGSPCCSMPMASVC